MQQRKQIKTVCKIGIFSALLILSSWFVLPLPIPITLQTFILFVMAGILKPKESVLVAVIYLLLGAIGVPVFAGFQSGIGVLLGPTGGFLVGFIPALFTVGLLYKKSSSLVLHYLISGTGIVIIYLCGCLWYMLTCRVNSVFTVCVLPFIIPDILKISLAVPLGHRLNKLLM